MGASWGGGWVGGNLVVLACEQALRAKKIKWRREGRRACPHRLEIWMLPQGTLLMRRLVSCQKSVNYGEGECKHCRCELAAAFGSLINCSSEEQLSLRACSYTRNSERAKPPKRNKYIEHWRRSHITFIYIRSSHMNHFIYITSYRALSANQQIKADRKQTGS